MKRWISLILLVSIFLLGAQAVYAQPADLESNESKEVLISQYLEQVKSEYGFELGVPDELMQTASTEEIRKMIDDAVIEMKEADEFSEALTQAFASGTFDNSSTYQQINEIISSVLRALTDNA